MFSIPVLPTRISSQSVQFEGTSTCSTGGRNPTRIAFQALPETASRTDANLYEILRVKETTSPSEIKIAYRSLAKQFHPDAATSEADSSNFIAIHNAYVTLSDPEARARYDLLNGAGKRRLKYAAGNGCDFVGQAKRWETDQCW